LRATVDRLAGTVELNCQAAALEDLLVCAFDSADSVVDVLELNIAKAASRDVRVVERKTFEFVLTPC
jgi:precorrin-6B methylase 2